MSKWLRQGMTAVGWLLGAALALALCCCAEAERPGCPGWDSWREWTLESSLGAAPSLALHADACGSPTALRVEFAAPATLTMRRTLSGYSSVGLTLDVGCTRAGYSIGSLSASAKPGTHHYQAALRSPAYLQLRTDEPCKITAYVDTFTPQTAQRL